MKRQNVLFAGLMLICALAVAPALARGQGKGLGVGLGSQTQVGVGGKTVGQVGGANVGVKTDSDAKVKTSIPVQAGASSEAKSGMSTKIESNPRLAAKVQSMLPSGESMTDAAAGFKNQGQFIAALHVSQNLKIPFDQLKTNLLASGNVSLGTAIKRSRPDITEDQANAAAKKAEKEAKETEKK